MSEWEEQRDQLAAGREDDEERTRDLASRVEAAWNRLVEVTYRIERACLRVGPWAEAAYAALIGPLESAQLASALEMERARRRLVLARRMDEAGVALDYATIERIVSEEFGEWQQRLEESAVSQRVLGAKHVPAGDEVEEERLDVAFRDMVALACPELRRDPHPRLDSLYGLARLAYARGDAAMLETYLTSARALRGEQARLDTLMEEGCHDAADMLGMEAELLCIEAEVRETMLEELMCEFPYSIAASLRDPAWVRDQAARISAKIAWQDEMRGSLERQLGDMLYLAMPDES